MCVCIYVYIYIYVCVCVCIVYIAQLSSARTSIAYVRNARRGELVALASFVILFILIFFNPFPYSLFQLALIYNVTKANLKQRAANIHVN